MTTFMVSDDRALEHLNPRRQFCLQTVTHVCEEAKWCKLCGDDDDDGDNGDDVDDCDTDDADTNNQHNNV